MTRKGLIYRKQNNQPINQSNNDIWKQQNKKNSNKFGLQASQILTL